MNSEPMAKELDMHNGEVVGAKRFHCGICDTSFEAVDELVDHLADHMESATQ